MEITSSYGDFERSVTFEVAAVYVEFGVFLEKDHLVYQILEKERMVIWWSQNNSSVHAPSYATLRMTCVVQSLRFKFFFALQLRRTSNPNESEEANPTSSYICTIEPERYFLLANAIY